MGTTAPRRFITPFTSAGVFGSGVTFEYPLISCTRRISRPYSSFSKPKRQELVAVGGQAGQQTAIVSIVHEVSSTREKSVDATGLPTRRALNRGISNRPIQAR